MPVTVIPSVLLESNKLEKLLAGAKEQFHDIAIPGEVIYPASSNLITGHGTYRRETTIIEDELKSPDERVFQTAMYASLAGHVKSVNKLIYVKPPKARYSGDVGDTVVGRIIEVEQRRWKVDINSYHLANLSLANVKLPTGELRRKSEDDERTMRTFLKEGDLIVTEVHEVYRDGSLQLHMPGKRTGRLGEGCLLRLPPSCIKRQKLHRHKLAIPRGNGADYCQLSRSDLAPQNSQQSASTVSIGLILGCNGYVWVGPSRAMEIGLCLGVSVGGACDNPSDLLSECIGVSRVRNIVLALAAEGISVSEMSVLAGCEASWAEEYSQDDEPLDSTILASCNFLTRLLQPVYRKHLASIISTKLGSSL